MQVIIDNIPLFNGKYFFRNWWYITQCCILPLISHFTNDSMKRTILILQTTKKKYCIRKTVTGARLKPSLSDPKIYALATAPFVMG